MDRIDRRTALDVLLALALAAFGVVGTLGAGARTDTDLPVDGWAFALVLVTALVLAVRRRWPLAVLVVAAVATSTYLVFGYPFGPILLSFFVAVYTAARHLPIRISAPAAGVAVAVFLLHVVLGRSELAWFVAIVPAAAWVVVPFAVGLSVRMSHESRTQARAEVVRQQVHEERMRVAQEVHDVVGHGLAAIKMQADVALHVLPKKPDQAEAALRAISSSSEAALDELRATLAVIRRPEESRAATPGLARLGDLEARMTHAGLRLRVVTSGEPRTLPAAVDLAAYRIVQESLTNVLRHADAEVATVRVGYEVDTVTVEVTNPGDGGPVTVGEGTGIVGMRERVATLGGTFVAGPEPDGGFQVRAVLPTVEPA